MNLCSGCRENFSSVTQFDRHRIGRHAYAASLEQPDGRRCLSVEEMEAKGWARNKWGAWSDPASVEAVRLAFSRSQSPSGATEAYGDTSETPSSGKAAKANV